MTIVIVSPLYITFNHCYNYNITQILTKILNKKEKNEHKHDSTRNCSHV